MNTIYVFADPSIQVEVRIEDDGQKPIFTRFNSLIEQGFMYLGKEGSYENKR